MTETIVMRNEDGRLISWARTDIRHLAERAGLAATSTNEAFLEQLLAKRPDLLGIGDRTDTSNIEGPFVAFSQEALPALNGRLIYPDLVLLWQSGHVVIVEVKLVDNPELRDRQVVAQLLEYAACFAKCGEDELLEYFGKERSENTWADLVSSLFPGSPDPERLAKRFVEKFKSAKLDLVIACDRAPRGLSELVSGVVRQSALGEYSFRVVEVMAFAPVSDGTSGSVLFLPRSLIQTEIIARTAVTVSVAGGSIPAVSVSVTPLDEQEAAAKEVRSGVSKGVWTRELFFDDVQGRLATETVAALRRVCDQANANDWGLRWGAGKGGTFHIVLPQVAEHPLMTFDSQGRLWANFGRIGHEVADELRAFLGALPGVSFTDTAFPSIKADAWVPNAERILEKLQSLQNR